MSTSPALDPLLGRTLAALDGCGIAAAIVADEDGIAAATAAFALAIGRGEAADLTGLALHDCIGSDAAARLRAVAEVELVLPEAGGAAAGWRAHCAELLPGLRLLTLQPRAGATLPEQQARQVQAVARRLEAAAEAARIGLWSAGFGDALPQWNRRMYEHFGLDPAQGPLALRDWTQRCVHPDDRQRIGESVRHWVQMGSGPVEVEFRVVRPVDATLRWLVARGRVARDDGAGGSRFEGVVIDITEQRETLQALRDTAERVELASTAVGLGSWQSPMTEARAYWDAQMFKLRGVESAGRWVGQDEIGGYLHPEDRDAVLAEQVRCFRAGLPWRSEFRVRWPDGTVRWLASRSSSVVDADGRVVRRIGLNWDVTDARLAEQARRERELAVAASQAKSKFLSRVSHELRTPLNAVLGFVQLLRDPASPSDRATRDEWLEHIETSGHQLLALIDDVLDLSRVDAGELPPVLGAVPLLEIVRSTLPQLARLAAERRVRISEPEALPGVVSADPLRLRQVLVSLLSNAVKFNRPGGRVWLASQRTDGFVELQVCDDGRGIDPQRFGELFQPFSRLGVDARDVEGTGIGLAIVRALVESMGGSVEVRSSLGQGATFTVRLPAAAAAAAEAATEAATETATEATAQAITEAADQAVAVTQAAPAAAVLPPAAPVAAALPSAAERRVLYVEDNPVNTLLVTELLGRWTALELVCAETGAEGIAQALARRPHLILLDMQLPDMSGLDVLRALRERPETAATPCVVLSANAMPADVAAARAAGFVDYWTKPIDFEQLEAGLARLLGRQR